MAEKVVVITGASAGIGAALAERLTGQGQSVVLVARRKAALDEVAARCAGRAHVIVADAGRRADVKRVVDETLARFGRLDVWVNNAGQGISRMPSQLTDEDVDEMIRQNVKSALYGMQVVLPHFQSRGRGHIINVSSMLGRVPFATQRSAYSAAKHALNALTASLRMDLRRTHPDIHVSTVSPGVVATEFGVKALGGGVDSRRIPGAQTVEEVAEVLLDVVRRPRADVYTRPGMREMVARYFAAEDMAEVEATLTPPAPSGAS